MLEFFFQLVIPNLRIVNRITIDNRNTIRERLRAFVFSFFQLENVR